MSKDFEFSKLKKDITILYDYEKAVLKMLFGDGDKKKLSELERSKSVLLMMDEIKSQIYAEATKQKLYEQNPELVKKRYKRKAVVYAVLPAIILFLSFINFNFVKDSVELGIYFGASIIILLIAVLIKKESLSKKGTKIKFKLKKYTKGDVARYFVLIFTIFLFSFLSKENHTPLLKLSAWTGIMSYVIIIIYARFMDRKTKSGVISLQKYKELKEWMEKYPLREEKMFNEFLPYSIVFGIHKKWAKKFEESLKDQKIQIGWYSMCSNNFVDSFSSFTSSAYRFGVMSGSGGGFGGGDAGGGGAG